MEGIRSLLDYVSSRSHQAVSALGEHALYVVTVTVAATVVAVGVGILVRKRPLARELALGIASVFLTIPSLALFVLFIPLSFMGLGFRPSFTALFLYALLPILRNTVAGLTSVSPAVLESARGMGLNARQRLWKIELPLAWPVIITGIRVSALLTTGIAAIATLVAGGGLGDFIKSGYSRLGLPNSMEAIWTGTILIVLLALTFDTFFLLVRRATTPEGIR